MASIVQIIGTCDSYHRHLCLTLTVSSVGSSCALCVPVRNGSTPLQHHIHGANMDSVAALLARRRVRRASQRRGRRPGRSLPYRGLRHPLGDELWVTTSAAHRSTVRAVSVTSLSGYARRVLLSDRDLRAEIAAGRLGIDPFDDSLVQPSSVDVRLDSLFRVFNNTRYTHIDPAQQQDELTSLVEPVDGEPFVLHPGEFVLGSTLELCTLPEDLAGRLEGKSSLGRLGLLTHSTAGFIDPGFSGHITLELSNVANLPITLWPGMKIGQLCILRLTSPAEHPYGSARAGSKYQGQRGPTPSRSYQNFIRST